MISNKSILIISPQNWNFLKVSKHYYAQYLALNNKVYFLNPIKNGFFNVEFEKINDKLNVITLKIPFANFLKFKLKYIFSFIINIYIYFNLNKIDIIWNFDNTQQFYLYNINKPQLLIFHPVDATCNINYNIGLKPQIIFSVSELILNNQNVNCYKYFINHGLSEDFINIAHENIKNKILVSSVYKVGYSGNLDIGVLNKEILLNIIKQHENITFYLIGPFNKNSKFYNSLINCTNVVFTGKLNQNDLINILNKMDLLILNYINDKKMYLSDNSHKILEYLSTGKIILSSNIKFYENRPDLIIQAQSDEEWIDFFNKIIKNPKNYNDIDTNKQKIDFAIKNSYINHLKEISLILSKLNLI